MRAVVMAYHEMGCVGLEAVLAAGFEVPLVVTHADDPREERWFRSVRELAERAGALVVELEDPNAPEHVACIAAAQPDLIFSFYFRKMIAPEILSLAKDGAFNLHGSLLPKYRGRAPVNWVLVNGETRTGVTLHVMDAKPDHGEIVGQRAVEIKLEDTALTLYRRLAAEARVVLDEALPLIRERRESRRAQDHTQSSYFGGRKPADGRIDWSWPAERVRNLVRAVTKPWPGAFTFVRGKRMTVWDAKTVDEPGVPVADLSPGQVVYDAEAIMVVAGQGCVLPVEVQIDGQPSMSWLHAARVIDVRRGERLGEEGAR